MIFERELCRSLRDGAAGAVDSHGIASMARVTSGVDRSTPCDDAWLDNLLLFDALAAEIQPMLRTQDTGAWQRSASACHLLIAGV